MKIHMTYDRKDLIWLVLFMVAASVLKVATGFAWFVLPVFALLVFLAQHIHLELGKKSGLLWAFAVLGGGAWLSVMSIQYMLLDETLFIRTKTLKLFLNFLVVLGIYLLAQLFTNHTAITGAFMHPLLLVFGLCDYFVYSFRGNEMTFADLKSAGTGISVAANYHFSINERVGYVLLAAALYMILCWQNDVSTSHPWRMRLACLMAIGGIFAYVAAQTEEVNTETWEQKGTYKNGFILNFCLQIRDSFIQAPEGYSFEKLEELEKDYEEASPAYSKSEVKDPTVIVIMNESFADLSVIGDFETNVELTPFLDSLKENTTRGYALASVYSAKTPNSEWEFLTGNSMAFLPQGSVVYQQYIDEEPNSLVSTMKNYDYTCVSMHPYYNTGWSRNRIYPTMGFDESCFIEDFDETQLLRKYITDEELYRKIIERYEKSPSGEKLFIMSISMQNHGGYGEDYDNMEQYVYKTGTSYKDLNQYLQLLTESDKALEKLITYFEQQEEPVEIVFFGDHQPGLNSKVYPLLNGKGLSGLTMAEMEALYTVPFFIWTNYDTEEEEIPITSLNYLSTLALERANLDLPAYNQFLAEMMKTIPAINSQGYYSIKEGDYMTLESATGEDAQWLSDYNCLQYNNMFGGKKRSSFFFPYLR